MLGSAFGSRTTNVVAMNVTATSEAGATSGSVGPWATDAGVWAVVVAGGSGARFGGLKQFSPLGGRTVIDWAVDALQCAGRTIVVVPAEHVEAIKVDNATVVAGGATRSDSVRAGLAALPATADRVLIHDGARPLVSSDVVGRVAAALEHADGAVPVVPVTDTLRTTAGEPVDRSLFVAAQTPQGFWVRAISDALGNDAEATDDATLVTQVGGTVVHVDGDPSNLKVTVADDLVVAEAILRQRATQRSTAQEPQASTQS